MDAHAAGYKAVMEAAAIEFLRRSQARLTPLENGLMPLDCDVTPVDNSQSNREGVSRTYKGEDGYAPMAGYLVQEGYFLKPQLRPGRQHWQKGTPELLQGVLGHARQLTAAPLLLRLDGDNDAIENIAVVEAYNAHDEQAAPVHYVTTWNPRPQRPEHGLAYAEGHGVRREPRAGKRVALFAVRETRTHDGDDYVLRRVMRVIERTIDKRGQQLLVPESGLEAWWTSLELDEETIIALYAGHATSGKYHRDFKTDLDVECLPSSTFCHQRLDPRLGPACRQRAAPDRADRTARRTRDAPSPRQTSAHPHRDAGADVPRRAPHPHRTTAGLRLRLPGGAHLSLAVHATGLHVVDVSAAPAINRRRRPVDLLLRVGCIGSPATPFVRRSPRFATQSSLLN
jgi:hypothetical protein